MEPERHRSAGGRFTTNLTSAQLAYNFSPRLFVQALIQYNDSVDLWSTNLLFDLLRQANTGLFIVYDDIRGLNDTTPSGGGRSLILKFSQMFDLIDWKRFQQAREFCRRNEPTGQQASPSRHASVGGGDVIHSE